MGYEDLLRQYRKGRFTDGDVTRCTGLRVRAWRELIKVGAARTVTQNRGPGQVRLYDTTTFKRAAVIGAIHSAGFSLAIAGRIAYFLPFEELLFAVCDPFTILFLHGTDEDPETGLPPKLKTPKADWFEPDKPAAAAPDDWLIEIYEARFIGAIYRIANELDPEPFIYADLRKEGTMIVEWLPFDKQRPVFDLTRKSFIDTFNAKWDQPNAWSDLLDRNFLNYQYEDHNADDDPLRLAAEATARNPLFKTTINVTLAIRKALRRYLGIEPAEPFWVSEKSARQQRREHTLV
jgi:hypothetical protein